MSGKLPKSEIVTEMYNKTITTRTIPVAPTFDPVFFLLRRDESLSQTTCTLIDIGVRSIDMGVSQY